MKDTSETRGEGNKAPSEDTEQPPHFSGKKKKHLSMHEGIGAWADCCSCEAEPYWRELAEEMGVDFNEYEDGEFEPEEGEPQDSQK